jgi:hypothetical protein
LVVLLRWLTVDDLEKFDAKMAKIREEHVHTINILFLLSVFSLHFLNGSIFRDQKEAKIRIVVVVFSGRFSFSTIS